MTPFQAFHKQLSRKNPAKALELLAGHPEWCTAPQALLEACKNGHDRVVAILLEGGADPDVRSMPTPGAWRTPILRAVNCTDKHGWRGRACAERLAGAGADLDQRASFGMHRPLVHATEAGNREAANWLIDRGVTIGFEESCALGDVDAVRRGLDSDPQVATRGRPCGAKQFFTIVQPLDCVAGSNLDGPALVATARVLLDAGAAPGEWTREGKTYPGAAIEAAFSGNAAVLGVLLQRDVPAQSVVKAVLQGNDPECRAVLEPYAFDANAPGDPHLGTRLIHEEVRWGRPKNALWLLQHGADPNVRDFEGNTPLDYGRRRRLKAEWFEAMAALGAR